MAPPPAAAAPEVAPTARGVAAKAAAVWIVLPLFFLATGGSLAWWEAWAYCAVLLVPMTVFVIHMARHDPQFLARRLKAREKEGAQRRIQAWGSVAFLAALVLPGLDHRFGWSHPPRAAVVAALAVALGSYLAVLWVFLVNRWAGRTVETCADQEVISTGPYAIVRHPMYATTSILYLATPVALGSWWALLPALTIVPVFILRILNEEKVLLRELPGYEEYRRKVRFRLVPYIW